jgi:hypothetical protein
MRTIEPLPVEDDEQYISHVMLLVIGWLDAHRRGDTGCPL